MMTGFPLISGDLAGVAAGDVHEVEPLHVLIVLLRQQLGDVHSENIQFYSIHIRTWEFKTRASHCSSEQH